MKKITLGLVVIVAIFTLQLNVKTIKSKSDVQLSQMVRNAEACIESPYGPCCPADGWCYLGGGNERYAYVLFL